MTVTIEPAEFTMVNFDADRIREIAQDLVTRLDFDPDTDVQIEVDQTIPTGALELHGLDPIQLFAESGALEHPQRVRQLSEEGTTEALGRLLLEARDRLDPDFGAPPLDEDVSLPHRVAWDIYIVGRLTRAGSRVQRQRRLYQFRHRHGFSDRSDEAFETLWGSPSLTWDDIVRLSDTAAAAGSAVGTN